jgi:hypothetical protein
MAPGFAYSDHRNHTCFSNCGTGCDAPYYTNTAFGHYEEKKERPTYKIFQMLRDQHQKRIFDKPIDIQQIPPPTPHYMFGGQGRRMEMQ